MLLRASSEPATYEAMVSPGAKLRPGRRVTIAPDFAVEILGTTGRGTRLVRLVARGDVDDAIERYGHVPLPPYIARGDGDDDVARYQTVYARESGSVAAPTAGLHFTPELLDAVAARGVARAEVVLHVGAGTFKPVDGRRPRRARDARGVVRREHERRGERERGARAPAGRSGRSARRRLARSRARPARTASCAPSRATRRCSSGPAYRFRAVDRLVTNFHLPRSTLLMLVAAFAGYELTMHAYDVAVREGYRFYSYGDAMVIL